jgi:hypothetical protein
MKTNHVTIVLYYEWFVKKDIWAKNQKQQGYGTQNGSNHLRNNSMVYSVSLM